MAPPKAQLEPAGVVATREFAGPQPPFLREAAGYLGRGLVCLAVGLLGGCSSQTAFRPGGPGASTALDEQGPPQDAMGPYLEGWRRSPLAVGERAALAAVDEDAALDADHGEDLATYRRSNLMTINQQMVQRCRQVRPHIERAGVRNGIDPLLLLAIAWVESGFNSTLESSAGARGVMQLIPSTGAALGCRDLSDVNCSAEAAAVYMGRLLRRYNGDLVYALCAYNAGHVRPTRAWKRGELPANLGFATRVLEARSRLERNGCEARGGRNPAERSLASP